MHAVCALSYVASHVRACCVHVCCYTTIIHRNPNDNITNDIISNIANNLGININNNIANNLGININV